MYKLNESTQVKEYREKVSFPVSEELLLNTSEFGKTLIEEISESEEEGTNPLFNSLSTIESLKMNLEMFKKDTALEKKSYEIFDSAFPFEHFFTPEIAAIYLSLKVLSDGWIKPLKSVLLPIVRDIQRSKYLVNKISDESLDSLFVDTQTYLLRSIVGFVENGYLFEEIKQVLDLIKTRLIVIENYVQTSRNRKPISPISSSFQIYPMAEKIDRLLRQNQAGVYAGKYE
ncbi:MAG: hypothetical protein RBS56_04830 [Candidatus Gracilibacteria bacterium]|jgi:hypothetical protein|nr:hypothetical protein [Candidatus Gracilibacteria bacterium]